ncbi:hypothetical protein J4D99_15720 [Siccationidurans ginsengisoli]|nr:MULTISPECIES: hypothetical protein [unclassified Hymenobacter]MBO2032845.1 hypothetical protein [Hymenobacter sp. BT559]
MRRKLRALPAAMMGLGDTQPVADNNMPAERPRNRRVVVRPIEAARPQP